MHEFLGDMYMDMNDIIMADNQQTTIQQSVGE